MANDLVIPVGYAQCAVSFLRDGDPEEMWITFGVSHSDEENVASNVALGIKQTFQASSMPSPIHCVRVTARVALEGEPPAMQEAAVGNNGSSGSNIAPQNVALLVKKVTGHGGRRGRGRMYIPYIQEADVDSAGNIVPSALSTLNTFFGSMLTDLADTTHGASTPMVLLHREGGSAVPLPYPVTGLAVDARVATQRQRLRR